MGRASAIWFALDSVSISEQLFLPVTAAALPSDMNRYFSKGIEQGQFISSADTRSKARREYQAA